MRDAQSIIKRPLLTEKSSRLRETGGAAARHAEGDTYAQQVVFEVARDANKIEIRGAVQSLFKVTVTSVRTLVVRGKTVKRDKAKKVDYILYYKPNIPLAVVEAKDNNHAIGAGMQQALDYAEVLDLPFAYSSNGDAFLEHDRTGSGSAVEREIPIDQFPSPDELWARYRAAKRAALNAL